MVFNTGAALLDAIVLAVISREKDGTYGYKITQDVRSVLEVSESTLYPVLRRLMKDGCLAISGTAKELIDSMPEPVWSCTVPKSRIDSCLKAYKVANVKTIPGGAELRIVSKGLPAEDAVRVKPTLEDVFLCYFGERTDDSDGTV